MVQEFIKHLGSQRDSDTHEFHHDSKKSLSPMPKAATAEAELSVSVPRLISLQGFCMLFDEVASRSFLKRRCDRLERTIEHLLNEVDALKQQDRNLQSNITALADSTTQNLQDFTDYQHDHNERSDTEINRLKQENKDQARTLGDLHGSLQATDERIDNMEMAQ